MSVTALYASLVAMLFVVLSVRTISTRREGRVEIGDGGNKELLRRMRVHANFAEYAPIALILMALAEVNGLSKPFVHALGATLLVGRLAHAYGLSQTPHVMALRVAGMAMTFTAILAAATACLALALRGPLW